MKRSQTTTTVASDSPEPEEGGFPTYELRQSRRSINMRNGSAKNIYARYVVLIVLLQVIIIIMVDFQPPVDPLLICI